MPHALTQSAALLTVSSDQLVGVILHAHNGTTPMVAILNLLTCYGHQIATQRRG
jgi:hypothetical protein